MPSDDPLSYRRRAIGTALQRFRAERRLTQERAARLLDRSAASLSAYENGVRAIRPRDLAHILDAYGITDEALRRRLLYLAAQGRRDGWWHGYEERVGMFMIEHVALEADASRIRTFEPTVVHGLLQTPEYARAVISGATIEECSQRDLESGIEFRMNRQRILSGDSPPLYQVVLGEGALRLRMGSEEVVRGQYRKLLAACDVPHIELQILPFEVGAYPGLEGRFTLFDVGVEETLRVVSTYSMIRNWYVDDPLEVDHYARTHDRLREMSLTPERSRDWLEQRVSS
ncbi:helix-turn-helix domain-containing protein [Spirillospora sp. NPDC127200]